MFTVFFYGYGDRVLTLRKDTVPREVFEIIDVKTFHSTAKNVVATLNMFFGIGALFSVFVLAYIDLINFVEVMRCILLAPGVLIGLILGRQTFVKNYVNMNLKKIILIVCFISALIVLGQILAKT